MADTTFTNGVTLTDAAWFQDVNNLIYRGIVASQLTTALKFTAGLNNIASAATVNLSTATSNTAHITGTTGISAFTMTSGQVIDLVFDGVLTLTHHATNNNLPGAASITTAAGDRARYWYDGTTVWCMIYATASGAAVVGGTGSPPVRQTVLSGPVDTNGASAFGGSTGSTTVTATGTLKATAAAGGDANYTGSITNPSWTGLSTNGTMYLYLDITSGGVVTTGSTTLAPSYQWGGTYSTTNNQHTFNIQEMTMKAGNGATASQVYRVFLGEVTVAGGVVTAITWYALMGRYQAPTGSAFPAVTTRLSFNHNLGVEPGIVHHFIRCKTAELNYSVGDRLLVSDVTSGGSTVMTAGQAGRLDVGFITTSATPSMVNKTTGALAGITRANWEYMPVVQRGW